MVRIYSKSFFWASSSCNSMKYRVLICGTGSAALASRRKRCTFARTQAGIPFRWWTMWTKWTEWTVIEKEVGWPRFPLDSHRPLRPPSPPRPLLSQDHGPASRVSGRSRVGVRRLRGERVASREGNRRSGPADRRDRRGPSCHHRGYRPAAVPLPRSFQRLLASCSGGIRHGGRRGGVGRRAGLDQALVRARSIGGHPVVSRRNPGNRW
jgi:hypothetical protein